MKIVINSQIGTFYVDNSTLARLRDVGLQAAKDEYEAMWNMPIKDVERMIELNHYPLCFVDRTDPNLIQVVEEQKSMDNLQHLKIIEIPDNVEFYILENEMGVESVHEEHRIWN